MGICWVALTFEAELAATGRLDCCTRWNENERKPSSSNYVAGIGLARDAMLSRQSPSRAFLTLGTSCGAASWSESKPHVSGRSRGASRTSRWFACSQSDTDVGDNVGWHFSSSRPFTVFEAQPYFLSRKNFEGKQLSSCCECGLTFPVCSDSGQPSRPFPSKVACAGGPP